MEIDMPTNLTETTMPLAVVRLIATKPELMGQEKAAETLLPITMVTKTLRDLLQPTPLQQTLERQ
jgi:hypothetical protein